MKRFKLALLLCAIFSARAIAPAAADPDFSGRTVSLVVGFEAGGAYDLYARMFARYLGAHLPGKPTIVVENMPGAGGLSAADYLYNAAPRDGTYIGMISQTAAIGQALKTPGIKYDVRKFGWIGRLTANVQLLHTWHTSATKSFADALRRQVIVAGTGPTSSSVVFPEIMNDQLGTKFKVVPGFQGVNSATLAMEQGEVDAVVRPWADIKAKNPDWIKKHMINPIVQFALVADPEIKGAPAIVDLAKNSDQRQLFALFASGNEIGDSILAPPGLEPDVLASLRAAYSATMKDPGLVGEAQRLKFEIDPLDGASLARMNDQVFTTPQKIIDLAEKYENIK